MSLIFLLTLRQQNSEFLAIYQFFPPTRLSSRNTPLALHSIFSEFYSVVRVRSTNCPHPFISSFLYESLCSWNDDSFYHADSNPTSSFSSLQLATHSHPDSQGQYQQQKYIRIISRMQFNVGNRAGQQLQLLTYMDISRSRLSSITEESNQEVSIKTQEALLKIYYDLYAINYVKWAEEPSTVFASLSQKIQNKLTCQIDHFKSFNQKEEEQRIKKHLTIIKQLPNQSPKKSRILSRKQIEQKIKRTIEQSPKLSIEKQEQFVQTTATKKDKQKQLDDTADTNIPISEILDKLNFFDEERTEIKFQIYSQDTGRVDHLYRKWSDLHKRMKEVLEVYVNKIGNGSSLLQIYQDLDRLKGSRKIVEGFSERHLLSKLDTYIQSLFLDQRQILLYRNSSEKSRSIHSGSGYGQNKMARKKLSYT